MATPLLHKTLHNKSAAVGGVIRKIMKYIVLTKSTFTWEVSDDDFESDEYRDKLDEYIEAQKELAQKYGMSHLWSESHFIQKAKHSIERCASCNEWAMDRVANPVKESDYEPIRDGASVGGKVLCYECLPEGHRWSWS